MNVRYLLSRGTEFVIQYRPDPRVPEAFVHFICISVRSFGSRRLFPGHCRYCCRRGFDLGNAVDSDGAACNTFADAIFVGRLFRLKPSETRYRSRPSRPRSEIFFGGGGCCNFQINTSGNVNGTRHVVHFDRSFVFIRYRLQLTWKHKISTIFRKNIDRLHWLCTGIPRRALDFKTFRRYTLRAIRFWSSVAYRLKNRTSREKRTRPRPADTTLSLGGVGGVGVRDLNRRATCPGQGDRVLTRARRSAGRSRFLMGISSAAAARITVRTSLIRAGRMASRTAVRSGMCIARTLRTTIVITITIIIRNYWYARNNDRHTHAAAAAAHMLRRGDTEGTVMFGWSAMG